MECPKCKLLNPEGAERCDCGYDFASGEMKASYLKAEQERRKARAVAHPLAGIRGWLLLPAAGLILGIPMALLEFVKQQEAGDAGEMAAIAVAGMLNVVVAAAFFQKKRWAPRLMIALLVVAAMAAAVPVVGGGDVPRAAARDLVQAMGAALIWIPYFLVSERVTATFTE